MAESTSFETREIFKDLFSVYIEIYNVELLKILMDYKKYKALWGERGEIEIGEKWRNGTSSTRHTRHIRHVRNHRENGRTLKTKIEKPDLNARILKNSREKKMKQFFCIHLLHSASSALRKLRLS